MAIRCVVVAVVCLFGTSVNALTMQECRAQYKADQAPKEGLALAGLLTNRSTAALTLMPPSPRAHHHTCEGGRPCLGTAVMLEGGMTYAGIKLPANLIKEWSAWLVDSPLYLKVANIRELTTGRR
jgi:hypothetical protein